MPSLASFTTVICQLVLDARGDLRNFITVTSIHTIVILATLIWQDTFCRVSILSEHGKNNLEKEGSCNVQMQCSDAMFNCISARNSTWDGGGRVAIYFPQQKVTDKKTLSINTLAKAGHGLGSWCSTDIRLSTVCMRELDGVRQLIVSPVNGSKLWHMFYCR